MKAIIETGGKQYVVEEKSIIYVEKLPEEADKKVVFDKVLMLDSKTGAPYIEGAKVEGKVIKHGKQKKIVIFKYTQKSQASRRKQGHRQPYTKVEITKIVG
ncbi:MAG TPA: 50S ribosomal protein L21 [Bacilli bacterium]|nr:50S ribosomal protein L21 [Bacilli bacterium]